MPAFLRSFVQCSSGRAWTETGAASVRQPRPARSPAPGGLEVVAFPSEGATPRGWLCAHAEHTDAEPQRRPSLVMAHGFTATISGMVADRYAQRLHACGLQVLLFDHRGFGLSGGFPRPPTPRSPWRRIDQHPAQGAPQDHPGMQGHLA
jgi:pimeloyl-ACP methyl ester carboxylesterase